MASVITGGSNTYAGGINYGSPALLLGASNGAATTGGLSFDLPLATVAAFTNNALQFSANNSDNNRAFLGGVVATQQSAVSNASNAALTFGAGSLGFLTAINNKNQDSLNFRSKMARGGGCFITTAICELDSLPDDCEELTILRKFRDDYMLPDTEMAAMVREYYECAPAIVSRIRALPNGVAVFRILQQNYLLPAIVQIRNGDMESALTYYVDMVRVAQEYAQLQPCEV